MKSIASRRAVINATLQNIATLFQNHSQPHSSTSSPEVLFKMPSRKLVSRATQNQDSSPGQAPHQSTPLPRYEAPSCRLSESGKRALDDLRVLHDYSKYKQHLTTSIKTITGSVGDSNDRLRIRKDEVEKIANKRRQAGEDGEKSKEDLEREQFAAVLEKKVGDLTTKADKALRELIDYSDELAMRDTIMRDISDKIAAATPPIPAARRRPVDHDGENDEGDENVDEEDEAHSTDEPILSALELLQKAQEEYKTAWTSKSLRTRYLYSYSYTNFDQKC